MKKIIVFFAFLVSTMALSAQIRGNVGIVIDKPPVQDSIMYVPFRSEKEYICRIFEFDELSGALVNWTTSENVYRLLVCVPAKVFCSEPDFAIVEFANGTRLTVILEKRIFASPVKNIRLQDELNYILILADGSEQKCFKPFGDKEPVVEYNPGKNIPSRFSDTAPKDWRIPGQDTLPRYREGI